MTYARRYSLMSALGIAPEDDDGNAATAAPPKPQQQAPQPTRSAAPGTLEPTLAKLLAEFHWPDANKVEFANRLLAHYSTDLAECVQKPEVAKAVAVAINSSIGTHDSTDSRSLALQTLFASIMEPAK